MLGNIVLIAEREWRTLMIKLTDGRRLIDADDLIEVLLETRREYTWTILQLIRIINAQPTIVMKEYTHEAD